MRLLDSPSPTWSSDSSEENEYGETTEKVESAFRSIDAPLGSKRRYGNDDGSLIKIKIPRIEWLAPANKESFDEPMYREYSFDPRSFGSVELASSSSYRDEMEVSMQTEQPSSGAGISASDTRIELPQSESPIASTEIECNTESGSSLSVSSTGDSDQIQLENRSSSSRVRKSWTEEEIEVCKKMKLAGNTDKETAEKLDRTVLSVRNMLVKLNSQRPKGQKLLANCDRWPKKEIKLCEELRREGKTCKEIAEKLGRSYASVRGILTRTNLKRSPAEKIPSNFRWTKEEMKLCEELKREGKTCKEIAEKLGRSYSSVRGLLTRINGKRSQVEQIPTNSWWTKEKIQICQKMKQDGMSYAEIAEKVGKTAAGVRLKLRRALGR